jgi:predicted MFS family arabinose efflux permease
MPVLVALAAAAFLSTIVIRMTDPLAPLLAHDLGVPTSDLALLATAYALPYALFQLVLGPVGDRLGKLRVVRVAVVLLSAFILMTAWAPDFPTMVAARVLSGAIGGGIIPLGLAMVGDLVPMRERQVVISRFMTAVIVGQITGAVLTGLAAEFLPWRMVLTSYAAITCAVGLGLFLVPAAAPANPAPFHPGRIVAQYRAILSRPGPRTLLAFVFAEGAILFGYLSVLPPFLAETRGFSAGQIGLLMAMVGGGGILYALTVKHLLRFFGAHRMTVAGGVIGGVAALIGLLHLPYGGYFAVTFGMGICFYLMHSNFQTRGTEMAPEARGASLALFACAFFLGNGVGPWLISHSVPYLGYTAPLGAAAVLTLGFGWLAARRLEALDRRAEHELL